MTNENVNALSQLLGCYFHQDWLDEHETDLFALRAIAKEASKEQLMAGLTEIDQLLSAPRSDTSLGKMMVDKVGCYFEPASRGMTYRAWLQTVREVFSAAVM